MIKKGKKRSMIGLEVHGYLDTKEKLFCRCRNFHDMKKIKPSVNICPICSGQPGSKPMLPNSSAINKILQIGLMLRCKINGKFLFQRKHYDWPDMPTGYQKTISGAYSIPVGENGKFLGIRIREVHLEEDPAAWNPDKGTIDYNRSGAPLIEIVTEPDFTSAGQVKSWLRQLVLTLSYIKALNKDAGIKADVNVNIKGLTARAEIKNVNSVKEIVKAIKSELERHEKEKPKELETRRWNPTSEKTELMRTKEEQADYRFIPDPDLAGIKISKKRIQKILSKLPESPQEKLDKIIKKHKINLKDAEVLTQNLEIVELYENVIKKINPKFALPWVTVELLSVLNYNKKTLNEVDIKAEHMIGLLKLLKENKITPLAAKQILRKFIPKSFSPLKKAKSVAKISDEGKLLKIIYKVYKKNQQTIKDYKAGEQKAFNHLMGQVMKETNRRADYMIVRKLLKKELNK